jgi:hypothetical protein
MPQVRPHSRYEQQQRLVLLLHQSDASPLVFRALKTGRIVYYYGQL